MISYKSESNIINGWKLYFHTRPWGNKPPLKGFPWSICRGTTISWTGWDHRGCEHDINMLIDCLQTLVNLVLNIIQCKYSREKEAHKHDINSTHATSQIYTDFDNYFIKVCLIHSIIHLHVYPSIFNGFHFLLSLAVILAPAKACMIYEIFLARRHNMHHRATI